MQLRRPSSTPSPWGRPPRSSFERTFVNQFLTLLSGQFPGLLAYAGGIVLAVIFWRRYPIPSLLTLLSSTLNLVATFLVLACFVAFQGTSSRESLQIIVFLGNTLHMVGYGLLFAAVFIGRTAKAAPFREDYG
jgi:hypothetical protein